MGWTYLERVFERMGVDQEQGIKAFGGIYTEMTGLNVEDHDMRGQNGWGKDPHLDGASKKRYEFTRI